jgi:hypothetical protein
MNMKFLSGLTLLLCTTLACQPVIAVGGQEILLFLVLLTFLLGPPFFRLVRRIEEFRRRNKKDE